MSQTSYRLNDLKDGCYECVACAIGELALAYDVLICTFGRSEHGGGQLTLLRLDVAQGEPARVAVGHHRNNVVGSRQVTGRGRRLQHRQPSAHRNGENSLNNQSNT